MKELHVVASVARQSQGEKHTTQAKSAIASPPNGGSQ
jgi:hypothetical protein